MKSCYSELCVFIKLIISYLYWRATIRSPSKAGVCLYSKNEHIPFERRSNDYVIYRCVRTVGCNTRARMYWYSQTCARFESFIHKRLKHYMWKRCEFSDFQSVCRVIKRIAVMTVTTHCHAISWRLWTEQRTLEWWICTGLFLGYRANWAGRQRQQWTPSTGVY